MDKKANIIIISLLIVAFFTTLFIIFLTFRVVVPAEEIQAQAFTGHVIEAVLKGESNGQTIEGMIETGEELSFGDYIILIPVGLFILALAFILFVYGWKKLKEK